MRQTENAKNSKNKIFQKKSTANVKYPCLFSVLIDNRPNGLRPLKIIERRANMDNNMMVPPEINCEDALKYLGMAYVLKWFLKIFIF